MSYQLTGKIKVINEVKQVSDTFKVREFVVTVEDKYPQDIQLQVVNDKCDVLNTFAVGSSITVSFNLRGKEYTKDGNTRYFNTLDAWKIEAGAAAPAGTAPAPTPVAETPVPVVNSPTTEGDDLPF